MNVYILVKTHSNGVSVNRDVFSSEKKVQAELEYILETEEKHGWKVTRNFMLGRYPVNAMFHKIEKGDPSNTVMYHYEKHEVV